MTTIFGKGIDLTGRLGKIQLLELVKQAIEDSGWECLILSKKHPFLIRIYGPEEKGFDVLVYIWNCTHGGGAARAADEYRIQLTGVVPALDPSVTTLLLGWHAGYEVFVGFDIRKHSGQASASPSIQVREETLNQAHRNAFALYERQNDEIAVAFKPELFVEYALSAASLHKTGAAAKDLGLLNNLPEVTDEQIAEIANTARHKIVSRITRKFRAHDFRSRVLGAYEHRCAFCGVHSIWLTQPTSFPLRMMQALMRPRTELHFASYITLLLTGTSSPSIKPTKSKPVTTRLSDSHR